MRSLFCVLMSVLLVLAFTPVSNAAVDSIYEVHIIKVNGEVKADLKGDGTWITCWEGLKLMKGASLKTGAGSSAEIVFDAEGLNMLKLNENTEIVIDDSLVKMPNGSVVALFNNLKPGSSFTVKTPTAACGIRGSGMGVDHIGGMTVVRAYRDVVYVQGLDAAGNPVGAVVQIPEGWRTQVDAGGTATPPEGLTANELAVWDAFVAAVEAGVGTEAEELLAETDEGETDTKDLSDDKTKTEEQVVSPSS